MWLLVRCEIERGVHLTEGESAETGGGALMGVLGAGGAENEQAIVLLHHGAVVSCCDYAWERFLLLNRRIRT